MKDKVTSPQMMYAAAVLIISTSLLTKPLYTFSQNDSWFTVTAGFVVAALIFALYTALTSKFPGKSIIEINGIVFGSVIGKIFSALYIFFFLSLTCLDTNIVTNFINAFILPNTPMALILALFIAVCAWAVRKGPVNIMKYGVIMVFVSIVILLLNGLLLYKNTDFRNLLPLFELPLSSYLTATHSVSMIPFCDPFVLVMFIPDMLRPREFGKALTKGLMIGAAVLLFVVIRDISVLGLMTAVNSFPTYSAIRLIDVGDIITRMELVYISILVSLMFYKVSALFYATVSGVQRLFNFSSYHFLIYVFGALLLIYSLTVFRATSEHIEWIISGAAEFFQTFFLLILPLGTLITAFCRGFFGDHSSTGQSVIENGGCQT